MIALTFRTFITPHKHSFLFKRNKTTKTVKSIDLVNYTEEIVYYNSTEIIPNNSTDCDNYSMNSSCYDEITTLKNYTKRTPIYEETENTVNIRPIKVTYEDTLVVDFDDMGVTGCIDYPNLTLKKLGRGATWNDKDLCSCYNTGVPCTKFDMSDLNNITRLENYDDNGMVVLNVE